MSLVDMSLQRLRSRRGQPGISAASKHAWWLSLKLIALARTISPPAVGARRDLYGRLHSMNQRAPVSFEVRRLTTACATLARWTACSLPAHNSGRSQLENG